MSDHAGLPLVTLHGFLGAPSLWGPAFSPALAPRALHRWLPGHGPDPWVLPGAGFEQIVDAFAATLPARAALVGYSLGARLALALLARHPRKFTGALLIGVHPGLDDDHERRERARWDDEQAAFLEEHGLSAFVDRWQQLPLFATQKTLAPAVIEAQRAARLGHQPRAVAWSMRALGLAAMPSYRHAFDDRAPAPWLVTGELDTKFSTLAVDLARRWSGAQHTLIAGAGHNVPLETPEKLAPVARAWAGRQQDP